MTYAVKIPLPDHVRDKVQVLLLDEVLVGQSLVLRCEESSQPIIEYLVELEKLIRESITKTQRGNVMGL